MRVGMIAPPWVSVPPVSYGGTETVIDNLARGLGELGHEVELFTIGTSRCPVPSSFLFPDPVEPLGLGVAEAAHVIAAYETLADADVIHDHTMLGAVFGAAARPGRVPVVVTNHGPFTADCRRIFQHSARHASIVAISRDQAATAGAVPIETVIHHGIDLATYRPGPCGGDGDYLLFVGRMCADKGVHRAIRVARRAHRHLVVMAKMREPAEHAYFQQQVAPLLDDDITLLIEPCRETRLDLQQGAAALLNPIRWPEPFGLVMIEALATGTPVLAFGNGAAPEIVDHGRTGFVCCDEDAMVHAVGRLGEIDRRACRADALARFSTQRMAADYAALFQRLIDTRTTRLQLVPSLSDHPAGPRPTADAAAASHVDAL